MPETLQRSQSSIPFTEWSTFMRRFTWRQGEHLAAIAPTGAGKTTLFSELMPLRRYSIMFGTKPDDDLYRYIIRHRGFRRIESVDEIIPYRDERLLLWPRQRKTIPETVQAQQRAFRHAMNVVTTQKAWTVWVDESKYISEFLRLRPELTYMLEQLRSVKATVISGAQRPTYLPLSVLSNSTHVFIWKSNNRDDARKLADVGGVDAKEIMNEARLLGKHEFIYICTRGTSSDVIRSQVKKG